MKRFISLFLVIGLLITCMLLGATTVYASTKADISRAIAIVFDNSGSMYYDGNQAWCRATYAMEVFASMLNEGDTLLIYPMWPIEVNGEEYTMEYPFKITDSKQSADIRNIYTLNAETTPIESVYSAINGVSEISADKKYVIVLTDGDVFYQNGVNLKGATRNQLDAIIQNNAGPDLTMMYLGIGQKAAIPDTPESNDFMKRHAANSENVLSSLTEMCNKIFGRDVLPENHRNKSKNTIDFDISLSKLIVFVQGKNISNLKIVGENGNELKSVSEAVTQYSTKGAGYNQGLPLDFGTDKSLQGMMVTYEDCDAGEYTIKYSGKEDSIEVYYEPDADLDFVFTDSEGNTVDPNALYEGDYKVSFGMKDAKTGKLISSDLLGQPHYEGSYTINDHTEPIKHDGHNGEEPVTLHQNDSFKADLSVTYLSGYTIKKDSTDFGWPEFGIIVIPRPAGELKLEISGGDGTYSLQDLEEGSPYVAKIYYKGTQLTGAALESVDLTWKPESTNAEIKPVLADDHWNLYLCYKDPDAPQETKCGPCTVSIQAIYCEQGSDEAMTQSPLSYNIKQDNSALQMDLFVPESYIVIGDLDESQPMVVKLKLNRQPLPEEEFSAVKLQVDCGGIKHTVTPNAKDSSYQIKLLPTQGISEGDYSVKVSAVYTDHIGRETPAEDSANITLSNMPLWLRWLIAFLILLILFIIIWIIMHIRVLPKHLHTNRKISSLIYNGSDVTQETNFFAECKKTGAKMQAQYAGKKFGVSMDVTPGRESYLYKSQKRKSAEVKVTSVRKFGPAKIMEVMIGSVKYNADETSGKLIPATPNQKPFLLTNGMMVKYSGTIQDAGIDKDFEVVSKLDFKKNK